MKTLMMKIKLAAAAAAGIVALGANAELTWTTGSYTPADWTPAANNVLKGLSATTGGSWAWYTEGGKSLKNDVKTLTDGVGPGSSVDYTKIAGIKSGTLAWSFGKTADVRNVNIYTRWDGGGRDGICITKVEVKYAGSDSWVDLTAPTVDYGTKAVDGSNGSSGALKAVLAQSDGTSLAKNATALRLTFGAQDNSGTGYVEIEAEAMPPVGPATAYNGSDITKEYTPLDQVDGLSWSGATRAYAIGDEVVLVFTDTIAGRCSFNIDKGYEVAGRYLVVAGGGPGGGDSAEGMVGGGGGAGGMVTNDTSSAVFAQGTYQVAVGAGAAPKGNSNNRVHNNCGGDSAVVLNGVDVWRAKGGGGGGFVQNNWQAEYSQGENGGSGGGSAQQNGYATTDSGHGIDGQGHNGGRSKNRVGYASNAGGGGGAGKAAAQSREDLSSAGGDGLPCDITGEEVWYAGGGAGGAFADDGYAHNTTVAGGKGGGGSSTASIDTHVSTAESGVNTLGGGGAGATGSKGDASFKKVKAGNGGSGVVVVRLTVKKCDMIEGVTAKGAAEMYGVGFGKEAETIIVFKDTTPGACSFTLPHNAFARVLLVGGGGPGGYNGKVGMVGAGGGAGGMVTNGLAGTELSRGTYAVTVGKGGTPATSRKAKGANGGDSVIARQSGSDVFRAKGGGAGGNPTDNNDNAIQYSVGSDGGSGGGGAQGYTNGEYYGQLGGAGVEEQGHSGGRALDCQKIGDSSKSDVHTVNAGGGGGAGANGPNAESLWRGAKGGDGLPCDITGAEVWYAGGGAGGVNTYSEDKEFAGGKGGGGATRSFTKDKNDQYVKAGTDGLGGGGGGGISSTSKNNWTGPGRGGDGVVIVRIVRMKKPGMAVILVENDEVREEEFETLQEAIIAAQTAIDKGCNATIKVLKDTDETVDGNALDPSQEIVFVSDDDAVVPVVQTSTEIMREVAAGGRKLTANTPKLRTFLTDNEVAAYTALPATAAAISAALAEVPTVEGNNGLALWKDYALGITPTTSVKAAADASKDTDPDAITISIPTIDPQKASGDFTIKYQVVDRAKRQETLTATEPDKIKIPLATGIYDVKIVFEPAT